eukprot:1161187-Pelagomonas_calceolata.AAC.1
MLGCARNKASVYWASLRLARLQKGLQGGAKREAQSPDVQAQMQELTHQTQTNKSIHTRMHARTASTAAAK